MRRKLLWRLFASYIWVAAAALGVASYYGFVELRALHENDLREEMLARAQLVSPAVATYMQARDYAAVDRYCEKYGKAAGMRVTVMLPDGTVVGDTEDDPRRMANHNTPDRPEMKAAISGESGFSIRASETLKKPLMYVAVPNVAAGAPEWVVRVSIPVTRVEESLAAMRWRMAVAGAVAAALVALVSFLIARFISGGLERMRRGAERFAAGDFLHRVEGFATEELDALSAAMNRMAAQLAERIDIITRQQNEQEAVLSSMSEGVLAVDGSGKVINLNPAAARMLDAAREAVRGRLVHEALRKPDIIRFVESALESAEPVEDDIRIRVSGKDDRFLHASGAALRGADGGKIGALIVLHDVTRLQKLENVRRDFVANVSHEIRTPITSIKGFVETILDGAIESREDTERFLNIVLRHTDRLNAIVDDLLALSRIEKQNEGGGVELVPGELRGVVDSAVEVCAPRVEERGLRLEVACPAGLAARLNSSLLEQAVVNLIDNAVKYTPAGKRVRVSGRRAGETVVIEVEDEGCGIEKRHLPRLFERFYRVDQARSRELGGTGLGLSIVKHIVIAHGGSVEVDSTPGQGSDFRIILPALLEKQESAK